MSQTGPIRTHRLANGLRVVMAPDARVPLVGLSMSYAVGSADEEPGRTGFAHLFEHMMFQGSANVGKTEHLTALEAIGGDADATTDWDTTVYTDVVPSHQLPLALWLEADRLATLHEAITQETLDNQREVVKNERQGAIENVPYGGAEDELFALAFGDGHPYSHSVNGLMADLDAATLPEVLAFFETWYRPSNVVMSLVGDLDPEPTLELVERYFGAIPGGATPSRPIVPADAGARRRTIVSDEVPAAKLFLGCVIEPFGTDEWATADFAVDLLTAGSASRLQRRLVRELRLADDVAALAYPLAAGNAVVEIDVEAAEDADPEAVEAALFAELDRLVSEPPEEEELARIRLRRETERAGTMEIASERAERIGMYASLLDEPERFGQETARDRAITAEAIAALGAGPFSASNRVALWYLPSGE
ncbi:MAG TPA: pitrilysin family protein [Candidatus Limnocylindria bacterium]|nr:pitrilysin family protein [Candidatus Limnocylindria bacterium]